MSSEVPGMYRGVIAAAVLLSLAPAASAQRAALAAWPGDSLMISAVSQLSQSQARFGADLVARTLESALIRSRNTAREGAEPMPETIRRELGDFFPAEMLDKVRFKVGDTTPAGLAGFAMRNGNAIAVTLIDTIVFKNEGDLNNLALWAHELHHVHQYHEWGVDGFAQRYAFGWEAVEEDARERARAFIEWYKAKRAG
jgi:hypothetical protein